MLPMMNDIQPIILRLEEATGYTLEQIRRKIVTRLLSSPVKYMSANCVRPAICIGKLGKSYCVIVHRSRMLWLPINAIMRQMQRFV